MAQKKPSQSDLGLHGGSPKSKNRFFSMRGSKKVKNKFLRAIIKLGPKITLVELSTMAPERFVYLIRPLSYRKITQKA